MSEIEHYCIGNNRYDEGIFVEAMPTIFPVLEQNLDRANKKYGTKFRAVNALITNEDGQYYMFNLFNNKDEQCSGSSSIYEENKGVWHFEKVEKTNTIELESVTFQTLVEREGLELEGYDHLVIDVQGAELQVLKSMGKYLDRFKTLRVEVSTVQFYSGSVLFDKLNDYIVQSGFRLVSSEVPAHGDVLYVRETIPTLRPESKEAPMRKVKNRVVMNPSQYPDTFDVQVYLKSPGLLYIEVIRTDMEDGWGQLPTCTLYGIDGRKQVLEIGRSNKPKKTIVQSTNIDLIF